MFYHRLQKGKFAGTIKGFPQTIGSWCKKLKFETNGVDIRRYVLSSFNGEEEQRDNIWISDNSKSLVHEHTKDKHIGQDCSFTNRSSREREREQVIQYLGIASDEPKRIERHSQRSGVILPLVEIGWTEEMCRKWCEDNDLLSPIYTMATRGGCWFCHNQGIEQLRLLRKNYPDLWQLLLKWDLDSPVTFKADGHTVHDFDKRFQLEDEMLIVPDAPFRWKMLDEPLQMRFF